MTPWEKVTCPFKVANGALPGFLTLTGRTAEVSPQSACDGPSCALWRELKNPNGSIAAQGCAPRVAVDMQVAAHVELTTLNNSILSLVQLVHAAMGIDPKTGNRKEKS